MVKKEKKGSVLLKKFLTALLFCMMCLLIALPASAEWNLSLDYLFGNTDINLSGIPDLSTDLDGLMFGVGYQGDRFGVDFLYASGDLDDEIGRDDEFSLGQVMGTYRFLKRDSFALGVTLAYADLKNGVLENDAFLPGIKAEFLINEHFNMDMGLGYSLFGANMENPVEDYDDASLWNAYVNFNFWFSENWGMHVGYATYQYEGDGNLTRDVDGSSDLYTLGFKFRFGAAKAEEPEPVVVEEPKVEEPKKEEPKEEPKVEEPKKEEPKEEPKVEEPKQEEKPVEEPKKEEPVKEPDITQPPKADETPQEKEVRIERVNEFLQPIFFNFDKYYIRKDQIPVLEKSLEVLNANSDLYILLGGHADPPGTNDYNMRLSQRRAETVRKWLIDHGIEAERITIVAYGEEYPFMAKSNDPKWESDRWVDIVMTVVAPTFETGLRK